jgi:hypothetical protein
VHLAGALHALAACYLILTLSATALAKLRRWRTTSIALIRESVVPAVLAPSVVIGVALMELTLSTLLLLEVEPVITGWAAISLLAIFGLYRLAVATRTNFLMCACAGKHEISPVSPPAIAAIVLTTALQACLAYGWMRTASRGSSGASEAAALVAWLAPFAALLAGRALPGLAKRVPGGVGRPDTVPYQAGSSRLSR